MKKKLQIVLVVIGCLIVLIGLSYAYFLATTKGNGIGEINTSTTVTIDNIGFNIEGVLEFNDLDIYPGHKNISKIKATAIGNNDTINYKLVWEGINTLNTPLKYYVYKTTTNEEPSITCKKEIDIRGASRYYYETCTNNNFANLGSIINEGEITSTDVTKEFVLASDEVIKGTEDGNIIYYYVVLEYPNLEESQNIDMGKNFTGIVTVKKESDQLADITIKKMYKETNEGYEEITSIPSEGYYINEEKSTCSNNAKPILNNSKVLVTNLSSSGTECNIYFDIKNFKTTSDIIAGLNAKTETPDFSQAATTDEGVFKTSDEMYGGDTYYWRGATTTNHVIFANKCWRIVRINGDKTMRLIYNGDVQSGNTCTGNGDNSSAVIMGSTNAEKYYATSDRKYNNSSYVGWTYSLGSQRTLSGTSSNAKTQTEKWYSNNITGTNAEKVADGKFCNDRNVGIPPSILGSGYTTTWSADGTSFTYAGAKRLYEDYSPTFACNSGDTYTLKVGAITADEVEFAGGNFDSGNSNYYLYTGQNYWTMSPCFWESSGGAGMFIMFASGHLSHTDVNEYNYGLRPVINLRSDTPFNLNGTGTQNNPYIVKGAE